MQQRVTCGLTHRQRTWCQGEPLSRLSTSVVQHMISLPSSQSDYFTLAQPGMQPSMAHPIDLESLTCLQDAPLSPWKSPHCWAEDFLGCLCNKIVAKGCATCSLLVSTADDDGCTDPCLLQSRGRRMLRKQCHAPSQLALPSSMSRFARSSFTCLRSAAAASLAATSASLDCGRALGSTCGAVRV